MLQAVITALPILILEIDEDGTILDYNSDSPSLFDVHPESFLNRHLRTYFPNHVESELQTVLSAIMKADQLPIINYMMNIGLKLVSSLRTKNVVSLLYRILPDIK
jgi:PAS domain-containing protein